MSEMWLSRLTENRLSHQDTWNMALCTKCPSKTRPRSKIFGSFLPSLHRHITNKMWFKKSSSVSTNHNWYLLVMCHIPFQILSTWSNEFETKFKKEALLALDILISYILRKILGGICYKYDATSLQRLWCMLCDQKLWLCSSITKPKILKQRSFARTLTDFCDPLNLTKCMVNSFCTSIFS